MGGALFFFFANQSESGSFETARDWKSSGANICYGFTEKCLECFLARFLIFCFVFSASGTSPVKKLGALASFSLGHTLFSGPVHLRQTDYGWGSLSFLGREGFVFLVFEFKNTNRAKKGNVAVTKRRV